MSTRIALKVLCGAGLILAVGVLIGKWCMWITDQVNGWPAEAFWFTVMGPGPFILAMTVLAARMILRAEQAAAQVVSKGSPSGGYTSEAGIRANEVPAVVSPPSERCPEYRDGKHHRIIGTVIDKDGCVVPRPRCAGCYKEMP